LFDKDVKSKTTSEQTAENCETISQGTHNHTAAKIDVKLFIEMIKRGTSHMFGIQAGLLRSFVVNWFYCKRGTVCSEISVEIFFLVNEAGVEKGMNWF